MLQSHHPRRHVNSFKYAVRGLKHAIKYEANFRIEVLIAILALSLGFYFQINLIEWLILSLALGALISAELLNTVIEEFIDHLIHEHHEGVRVIKDLCAGYVLVVSLSVLVVLLLVFVPRVYSLLVL